MFLNHHVSITIPLAILALLSVFGGFFGVPHIFHLLPNNMELLFHGFFAKYQVVMVQY